MKKRIFIFGVLAVLFCVMLAGCNDPSVDGPKNVNGVFLSLQETAGGDFYVVSGIENKNAQEISIPSSCDGIAVKQIGESAFAQCSALKSIHIPPSISEIQNNAFEGCTTLESVHITDLKAWIAIVAHTGQTDENEYKEEIARTYPLAIEGVTLYLNGAQVTELIVPDDVTEIPNNAFAGYEKLTSVTLGGHIESVGMNAFRFCTGLKSISTRYSGMAFLNCSSVESITAPWGFWWDFYYLNANTVKTLAIVEPTAYGSGNNGQHGEIVDNIERSKYNFKDNTVIERVTFPEGLSIINKEMFSGCTALTEVNMPNTVLTVDEAAFKNCTALKTVKLPEELVEIKANAFDGCTSLEKLTFPSKLRSIDKYGFARCWALPEISFPDSLSILGDFAFLECTSLKTVTIPKTLKFISGWTFEDCTALTAVVLPQDMTEIPTAMFYGCTSLTDIVIPESVKVIGSFAFGKCTALRKMVLPEGVTEIGDNAFEQCASLALNIPATVKTVGSYAFDQCSDLRLTIAPEIKTLDVAGHNIAGICSELNCSPEFYINRVAANYDRVEETIATLGFNGEGTLEMILSSSNAYRDRLPDSLKKLNLGKGVYGLSDLAIELLTNLNVYVTVEEGNIHYSSEDGALYNRDKTVLYHKPTL